MTASPLPPTGSTSSAPPWRTVQRRSMTSASRFPSRRPARNLRMDPARLLQGYEQGCRPLEHHRDPDRRRRARHELCARLCHLHRLQRPAARVHPGNGRRHLSAARQWSHDGNRAARRGLLHRQPHLLRGRLGRPGSPDLDQWHHRRPRPEFSSLPCPLPAAAATPPSTSSPSTRRSCSRNSIWRARSPSRPLEYLTRHLDLRCGKYSSPGTRRAELLNP